jgi:hypothetical protein
MFRAAHENLRLRALVDAVRRADEGLPEGLTVYSLKNLKHFAISTDYWEMGLSGAPRVLAWLETFFSAAKP